MMTGITGMHSFGLITMACVRGLSVRKIRSYGMVVIICDIIESKRQ